MFCATAYKCHSPLESKRGSLLSESETWEIIADNLSKVGWSWGCVSAKDSRGRTIFVVDAHRDGNQRFIVRADEKLTAFVELESQLPLKRMAF